MCGPGTVNGVIEKMLQSATRLILVLWLLAATCVPAATDVAPRLMVQSRPGSAMATGGTVVFAPDGALLATTSNPPGSMQIWEVRSGRLLCNLGGAVAGNASLPGLGIPAIAFSRDSASLAAATGDGAITLWDLRRCGEPARVKLDPAQRKPVQALSTLSDGRVLMLAGDGRLYVADLFRRQGKLEALAADTSEASMLLAHTPDGRVVLEARFEVAAGPLPSKALFVRDRTAGNAQALSTFDEAASAADLMQAAALSPSGRWIAVHSGGQLTLYDRTARRVAARTELEPSVSAERAALAAELTPPPQLVERTVEKTIREQRQRQLQRMEEKIGALPPEQQAQLRAQVEQALAKATQEIEQRAQPAAAAIPAFADSLLRGAQWIGFSADEERIYVWRNTAGLELSGPNKTKNLLAFEVRRRSDLALLTTHTFDQTTAGGAGSLLFGVSFAQSEDRAMLALQAMGVDGARMAIVDLARPSLRAWSPNNGLPTALAWDGTDRLVTAHALLASDSESALLARTGQMPTQADPRRDEQERLATRFVRWDLTSGDVAERGTTEPMIHSQACVAAGGDFFARATLQPSAGALPQIVVHAYDTSSMSPVWNGRVRDATGQAVNAAPIACAISADGKRILVAVPGEAPAAAAGERRRAGGLRLLIVETGSGRTVAQHDLPFAARRRLRSLAFVPDARHLLIPAERELYVLAFDATPLQEPKRYALDGDFYGVLSAEPLRVLATPAGRSTSRRAERRRAAEAGAPSAVTEAEPATVVALPRIPGINERIAVSDANGQFVAASGADNRIELHRVVDGALHVLPATLAGHSARITAMAFSPDARFLASGSDDGAIVLWNVADGKWLAKLFTFVDGTWAVVDAQGRFDTNNLEEIEQLHWVMPDDPLRALPLEIFMRDYYQPRLLPRLLAGEAFAPVRDLSALNRAQPEVRIAGFEPSSKNANRVTVTVEVAASHDARGQSGAVHGVRLFRDGQLVGINPVDDTAVPLDANGSARVRFENIALPSGAQPVHFAAYAFNRDRVKSATARARYERAAVAQAAARAYVIAIGVNEHDSPVWKLNFAANDARRTSQVLQRRLAATQRYAETIAIPLLSEGGTRDATKTKIAAVLAVLAGKPAEAQLQGIPGADKLKTATPDDLVVIAFSGHGLAGSGGAFYLLPSDTGASTERRLDDELRRRAISTDDLAQWLREVDAGDIMMIVDACHSAATVDSEGFKPGPMGARGLGQLAYDKGVRILAASQADDVAREVGQLRHGLLTYALIQDGIENAQADFRPRDKRVDAAEWLNYGAARVPQLHAQGNAGEAPGRGANRPVRMMRAAQQPKLFDFARARRQPVIAVFD